MPRLPLQFVVLGNTGNRRVALFQQALARLELPPALEVSWLDAIAGRVDWERLLHASTFLRIDSPGEDFAVERALLAEGAEVHNPEEPFAQRISRQDAEALRDDHGLIRYPRQWFLGFKRVLERLEACWNWTANRARSHSVNGILKMFDKVECQRLLHARGIPVPRVLPRIRSFDELIASMRDSGIHRVFVKLAHGSSASGVVAYERNGSKHQAFTSAELVSAGGDWRLYNSLKVRRYTSSGDIARLIDMLASERVQVEAWVPKASLPGGAFDLRVLVIGNRAHHTVARVARGPMTNLHLGNSRGNLDSVRQRMPPDAWNNALAACESTLAAFPGCLHAGVDLIVKTDFARYVVAEANAFGDLLPNLLHEGEDPCGAQIKYIREGAAAAVELAHV